MNTYYVRVTYNGCIARDTIRVNIDPINPEKLYKYICGGNTVQLNAVRNLGESHLWNTGATTPSINVFNPGIYFDDISLNGCVTRDSFIVSDAIYPLGNDKQVCFGSIPVVLNATTPGASGYVWQNGSTAASFTAPAAGLYWVNVSFGNCSLRDTIVLSNIQPQTTSMSANICQGLTYTLPSGTIVSTAGTYSDTLRTTGGCDSLINSITLSIRNVNTINSNAAICPGQTYTLPWGPSISAPGIYRDTLRYVNSVCDSIRRNVTLTVQTASSTIINATICNGQSFTLPSGALVNTAGIYKDTLRYAVTGCDSLIRTVNITVQSATSSSANAKICAGQTYTLPWGTIVNTAGTYLDTLRYINTGCDSVRRTVNLTIQSATSSIANATICAGQTYILPWGTVVNTSGIYRDTLRYVGTGCDSLYRIVDLTVLSSALISNINSTICSGQTYTLPWGPLVFAPGIYRDTIRFANGCDSLYRTINLTVQSSSSLTLNPFICTGQSYTLPWGAIANTSGIYRDTLRYQLRVVIVYTVRST